MSFYCRSSYLTDVLSVSRKRTLATIVEAIKGVNLTFDSIAFTGMSGALVGPTVADALDKSILMVRKDDGAHSSYKVEGNGDSQAYVIVDDLISSGDTIQRILNKIKESFPETKCVGIFLYREASRSYVATPITHCDLIIPVFYTCFYD